MKTADQLNLPRPTAVYHNEVAQPTPQQQQMAKELSERASKIHSGTVSPEEDNMLKVTSDGRKLGLDQRIINPNLPDDPGSKVNMCVRNILRIWEDGTADKLTQLFVLVRFHFLLYLRRLFFFLRFRSSTIYPLITEAWWMIRI